MILCFAFSFREIIESLASGEINFYAVEYLNSRWESKDRSEQQKSRTVDLNETKRKCLIHNAMGDFIGNDAAIKHFLTSCIWKQNEEKDCEFLPTVIINFLQGEKRWCTFVL